MQTVKKYWMQPKSLQALDAALWPVKQRVSSAINYNIKAKMDANIHAAKLKASVGIFPVFDAGSISASKECQVPATIVLKQNIYSHICRQTKCKNCIQTYYCHKN